MVLLILFSLCSCKQKSDDEELASLNKENSVSKTEPDTEENIDTSPAPDKATDMLENESDSKTQFENTNDNSESTATVDTPADTVENEPDFNKYEHICNYQYIQVKYNEIYYTKTVGIEYLGEASIYHDTDFAAFELTEETVEIGYYCMLETDGYACHLKKTATICKLPEDMKNDKGIDFLIVRFEDGAHEMLANLKVPENSTLHELYEAQQRLYGVEFASSEYVEKIYIKSDKNNNRYEVTDRGSISEIYNIVSSAKCTGNNDKISGDECYFITLYNENNFKYIFTNCLTDSEAYTLTYKNGYISPRFYPDYNLNYEGFEEFLQTFMTEENLVKE